MTNTSGRVAPAAQDAQLITRAFFGTSAWEQRLRDHAIRLSDEEGIVLVPAKQFYRVSPQDMHPMPDCTCSPFDGSTGLHVRSCPRFD